MIDPISLSSVIVGVISAVASFFVAVHLKFCKCCCIKSKCSENEPKPDLSDT
jgi:hypothetical protein